MVDIEFLFIFIQVYVVFLIFGIVILLTGVIYGCSKLEKVRLFLIQNFAKNFYGFVECIITNESNQNNYGTINNYDNNYKEFINTSFGIKLTLKQVQSFPTFGINFAIKTTTFLYVCTQFLFVDEFYSNECVQDYFCYSTQVNSNLTCQYQNNSNIIIKSNDPFAFNCTSVFLDIKSIGLRLTLIAAFAKLFLIISKIIFNVSYLFFEKFKDSRWMIKNSDTFILVEFIILIPIIGFVFSLKFITNGRIKTTDFIEILYICFSQVFTIFLAHRINFDNRIEKIREILPVYTNF
jgi:hypothetical protein